MKSYFQIEVWLVCVLLIGSCQKTWSQDFLNEEFYLVDSLDANMFYGKEKELLDSMLLQFHAEKNSIKKINIIEEFIALSQVDSIWSQYNVWLDRHISKLKVNETNFTEAEQASLNSHYINVLINYGVLEDNRGNMTEALKYYFKSLEISKQAKFEKETAYCYNNIACVYHKQGKILEALDYFQKAKAYFLKTNDTNNAAFTYNNIAIIFSYLGDHETAINAYLEAVDLYKRAKNQYGVAICTNGIGTIKLDLKQPNEALKYFQNALTINKELGNKYNISINYSNIGDVYYSLGDQAKSLEYYQTSLKLKQEVNNEHGVAADLNRIARLEIENEQWGTAKQKLERSHQMGKKMGIPALISESAELLSIIAEKEHRYKESLKLYTLHVDLKDSISNEKNQKIALKQYTKFEYEKKAVADSIKNSKERELIKLKLEEKQLRLEYEKKIRWGLLAGILGLTVWVAFQIYAIRVIRKQKKEIEFQNKEREGMIWEIHHRVKNNLQIIKSLIGLQLYHIDNSTVTSILEEAQRRILTMAKIHENLYNKDQFTALDAGQYFLELINNIIDSYGMGNSVELQFDSSKIMLDVKTLVPLALIVNEVVSNSFKHAFSSIDNPVIFFEFKEINTNKLELKIGDNGIGDIRESKQEGDKMHSYGKELIEVFTEQLDGIMQRKTENGLLYILTFNSRKNHLSELTN